MERPIFQPVGTPTLELDTPALVLDLEVMEQNIRVMRDFFQQATARLRPHVSCHQCPNVARRQLAAEGTVGGIAVTTLGEAEVFSDSGFGDLLITNPVVTRPKIRRLCALARQSWVTVAVDNPDHVTALSEAATSSAVTLRVLVELNAGLGRCGVSPGDEALRLARQVSRAPGLEFQGLMAYEGPLLAEDREALVRETHARLQPVLDTRRELEQQGIPVATVSVGGTHNYDVAGAMPGVTEVQAGSYVLMDHHYCRHRPEFSPAVKLLASVISHPLDFRAVVDAGHKTVAPDLGLPLLEGVPGGTAARFSAEHGVLELEGAARQNLRPNDKVWLVPYDLAMTVNQFDYFRVVRQGQLEGFWPISARGRFD